MANGQSNPNQSSADQNQSDAPSEFGGDQLNFSDEVNIERDARERSGGGRRRRGGNQLGLSAEEALRRDAEERARQEEEKKLSKARRDQIESQRLSGQLNKLGVDLKKGASESDKSFKGRQQSALRGQLQKRSNANEFFSARQEGFVFVSPLTQSFLGSREELSPVNRTSELPGMAPTREEIIAQQSLIGRGSRTGIPTEGKFIREATERGIVSSLQEFERLSPEEARERAIRGDPGFTGRSTVLGEEIFFDPSVVGGRSTQEARRFLTETPTLDTRTGQVAFFLGDKETRKEILARTGLKRGSEAVGVLKLGAGAIEFGAEQSIQLGVQTGSAKDVVGGRRDIAFFDKGFFGQLKREPTDITQIRTQAPVVAGALASPFIAGRIAGRSLTSTALATGLSFGAPIRPKPGTFLNIPADEEFGKATILQRTTGKDFAQIATRRTNDAEQFTLFRGGITDNRFKGGGRTLLDVPATEITPLGNIKFGRATVSRAFTSKGQIKLGEGELTQTDAFTTIGQRTFKSRSLSRSFGNVGDVELFKGASADVTGLGKIKNINEPRTGEVILTSFQGFNFGRTGSTGSGVKFTRGRKTTPFSSGSAELDLPSQTFAPPIVQNVQSSTLNVPRVSFQDSRPLIVGGRGAVSSFSGLGMFERQETPGALVSPTLFADSRGSSKQRPFQLLSTPSRTRERDSLANIPIIANITQPRTRGGQRQGSFLALGSATTQLSLTGLTTGRSGKGSSVPRFDVPRIGAFAPPLPSAGLNLGGGKPGKFTKFKEQGFRFQPSFTAVTFDLRGGVQPGIVAGGFNPFELRRIGARPRSKSKGRRVMRRRRRKR